MKRIIFLSLAVLLSLLTFSLFQPLPSLAKEKIGVLFISVGENEDYVADWSFQFFNNMYDLFEPGFFAGGPIEGGRCYTAIHYADTAESFICGVAEGTPIDIFCQPYTGSYPIHDLMYWDPPPVGDDDFRNNCFYYPDPNTYPNVYYPLFFGANWVADPAGSGIGLADFVEMTNFTRMGWYYRWPGHKCYARKELLKWWYGNNAPGYSPDSPELINVKASLEALHPEYEFIYGHGWEAYMENEDAYGNPFYRPDSTETVIQQLIAAGAKKIIVADCYSFFSNLTQFGHEWYDSNGQGISAIPGKTFKQCVEDITDGVGPKTADDLNAYLTNKSWDKHWKHPFPLIKDLVHNQDSTVDVRFANPYGNYPEFEQAVVDTLNYTIAKYSIPSTKSLKVILLQHGYYNGYENAQECDSYFRLIDYFVSRVSTKVRNNFTWSGKFDVASGPGEFAEGDNNYDPPSSSKPFGNVISAGELVDQSINGKYVNELGQIIDNGINNYDYIIAIPFTFESFSSDTVYGKREQILGNNKYNSAYGFYTRDANDKDGTEYDAGDVDSEYCTVKTFDGTGWLGGKYPSKTPKGSATNPTTLIMTGCILDLNSASGYARSARQNLTTAEVKAISDALPAVITTTTVSPASSTTTMQLTTTTTEQPTAIELASFTATPKKREIILEWETASEINNAGFNIYRSESENGAYTKINAALIPTKGSTTQGASYEFVDTAVKNRKTYYYKLEDIDLNGTATMHGPVSATPRLILGKLN
ncbi:MAG: hypothetical protein NTV89_18395 [Proteobacteria bacterium]|nr:hypothetical protein [Pseudomonadota bacterium]